MANWPMIGSILLPNVGGWLGAITMMGQVKRPDGKAWYQVIKKPTWNPPDRVFGPAWTALYCSMGYASYIIYKDCGGFTARAMVPLALYGGQLVLNWTWTPVFFGLHKIGLGLLHMAALDVSVVACTASFYQVNPRASLLMVPYIAWLSFATCLNYTIWKLNKDEKKVN